MGSREGALKATIARQINAQSRADYRPPRLREPIEPFCPDERLLGRALIALAEGPLTFEELGRAVRLDLEQLAERAPVLRGHVHALRVGPTWIAFHARESWAAIDAARHRVLGTPDGAWRLAA